MALDDLAPDPVAAVLKGTHSRLGDLGLGSAARPARRTGPLPFAREHTVLYVDDEEENLIVFEATFEDEFRVICARDAEEALAILEEQPVSVLLADKRMPGMDGIELCELVRQTHPETARMLITAFSDQRTAIDAINRGGVQTYVVKPWSEPALRETLRAAITEAHIENLARSLDQALLENERLHGEAASRAKLLHDLGNVSQCLVNASDNLCDLAERLTGLPEDLAEQLGEAITTLRHALQMVVGLQEDRRASAKDDRGPVVVDELLQAVAHVVGPRLRASGIKLDKEGDGGTNVAVGRLSISRILINLVKNAQEALEAAGVEAPVIRISTHREGDRLLVDVSDNGPGVPEAQRAWIFGHAHSTKGEEGRGIGLSVSAELARENGGSLELLEEGHLGGATFRLTLPVA